MPDAENDIREKSSPAGELFLMDDRRKEIFAGYKKAGIFWTLRKGAFMISPLIYVKVWMAGTLEKRKKRGRNTAPGRAEDAGGPPAPF